MKKPFYANVSKLEDHLSICREERRLADELHRLVKSLAANGALADDRYRQLARDTDKIKEFMEQKANFVSKFEQLVWEAALQRKQILQKASDQLIRSPFQFRDD